MGRAAAVPTQKQPLAASQITLTSPPSPSHLCTPPPLGAASPGHGACWGGDKPETPQPLTPCRASTPWAAPGGSRGARLGWEGAAHSCPDVGPAAGSGISSC